MKTILINDSVPQDEIEMCYEEHPPIPAIMCNGHPRNFRWARVLSVLAIFAVLGLSLIFHIYAN
jgi:hypothetical protein